MMTTRRAFAGFAGFSLIELLVSAAILALLASVAMPLAETTVKRQKEFELRRALRDIRQAIDAYKQATASTRIAVQPGESGYPRTLDVLAAGTREGGGGNGPTLYFLRRIPRDPFHPDRNVPAADTWGKRSFASSADHPQEGDDVFDVYSLSPQTGLNGVPYGEW